MNYKTPLFLGLSILVAGIVVINIQQHFIDNQSMQLASDKLTASQSEKDYRREQLKSQQQHVFDVCNDSRISKDISENNCGFLQDKYNMEFICKQNNTSVNNMCWVEYKGTNYNTFVKES